MYLTEGSAPGLVEGSVVFSIFVLVLLGLEKIEVLYEAGKKRHNSVRSIQCLAHLILENSLLDVTIGV